MKLVYAVAGGIAGGLIGAAWIGFVAVLVMPLDQAQGLLGALAVMIGIVEGASVGLGLYEHQNTK